MHSQLFSNKTRAFYPVKSLRFYKSCGTLPDDLVRIPDSQHKGFYGAAPDNCVPYFNGLTRSMEWLEIAAKSKTTKEIAESNQRELKTRLREATFAAYPLRIIVNAGKATTKQANALTAIESYIIDLYTVELKSNVPDWPDKPSICKQDAEK